MNALAQAIATAPRWRLGTWALRAWRKMGWRHVLLALLIEFVRDAIHPLGGVFFPPVELPGWDFNLQFLNGAWAVRGVPIVYCVLVADEAFDDGVPPLRAYGLAVIALTVFVPLAARLFAVLAPWMGPGPVPGEDEGAVQVLWWSLVVLYECGFGLSIYAYWRVAQRAMRQVQAAETERLRSEQRVQTARLLALQSRVEPQLLFDALGRVGTLHDHDPLAADALLADLIALLRSLKPAARGDNSTVDKEFALVEAWLRVTRSTGREDACVRLQMTPESATVGMPPMLLLPLLREVLALPRALQSPWRISAEVVRQRLRVTLQPDADSGETDVPMLAQANLGPLHEQITRLFGPAAQLAVSARPQSMMLDLPPLLGDDDDHGIDR
jgi:hypothetical protein